MTIPYRRISPLLSAAHILGSVPATDKESITIPGPSTNEEVWKSRLDIGFRAAFDSMVLNTNFKASSIGAGITPLFCGTAVDDNAIGVNSWANPTYAEGDTTGTVASAYSMSSGNITHYLKCTNFGFSLPSDAVISGILVEIEGVAQFEDLNDYAIRIVKGGTISSTDRLNLADWPTTKAFRNNGGADDLWGETWTYSDINSSGFGVAISLQNNYTSGNGPAVSRVRITVYLETVTTKFQIKPYGQSWEDIPGTSQTVGLTGTPTESPVTVFDPTLTNHALPADIRLLCTATADVDFEIFTQHNSVQVVGNSVTGTGTKHPFDWAQYIKSAKHFFGSATDVFIKEIDNPSAEIAFMGYVDPGFPGTVDILEMNTNVLASVDSGTQSTILKWQIRPVAETVWKDAISKTVTLTTTPTAQKFHDDLLSSDFTGWTYGLKGPFEFRLTFTATGTGKTFTFTTNDDHNYTRLIGDVD